MATSHPPNFAKSAPLHFMNALNPTVAYLDPKSGSESTSNQSGPELIILCTWLDARDSHIAKYIAQYREIYPIARILLIRSSVVQYFCAPLRIYSLKSALPVLREFIAESKENETEIPRMLIHIFSNGGMATAVTLWNLLNAEVGARSIPFHVTIMDSCPGYGRWTSSHYALSLSVPSWLSPLVHLAVGVFWLMYVPTGLGLPQDNNAAALNAISRLSREVRRTYILGTGDKAVAWQDAEAHGCEARELGLRVRTEMFKDSGHVAHMRMDTERYWKIVTETWEQNSRD